MLWPPCPAAPGLTAQLAGELLAHLEWWRAYDHFCHPHLSPQLKLDVPQARRGKQTPRRYGPRTPAMAAGLSDHLWSVEELLVFPVGQRLERRDGGMGSRRKKNESQPQLLQSQKAPSIPAENYPRQKWQYQLHRPSGVEPGQSDALVIQFITNLFQVE